MVKRAVAKPPVVALDILIGSTCISNITNQVRSDPAGLKQ